MDKITPEVYKDIKDYIFTYIDAYRVEAKEYDGIDITFAISEDGDTWNVQTGDNSYTGACYGLPHWAVDTIQTDTDPLELYDSITDQLEELLVD